MPIRIPQEERPVGVVLGGGGFKGAFQAGVLQAMQREGVPIDVVCAVSVGSLNGALATQGDIGLLEEVWLSIDAAGPKAIFDYWPIYKQPFKKSLCSNRGLRNLLVKYVRPDKLKNSSIKFYFCATCLEDGQLRYFDNSSDHIIDGLLASCAAPVFFEPVEIEGRHYVDGGVLCNVPVRKALEAGCNLIFPVMTSQKEPEAFAPSLSRISVARRSLDLLMHSRDSADLEIAHLLAEKAKGQWSQSVGAKYVGGNKEG